MPSNGINATELAASAMPTQLVGALAATEPYGLESDIRRKQEELDRDEFLGPRSATWENIRRR